MSLDALEKELAIRKMLAVSSDCVWRKALDEYGACWANDGEWRIMGLVVNGREAIKVTWGQFMDGLKTAWQVTPNMIIEVDGEVGYGRLYIQETLQQPDGSVNVMRGIYHDTYKMEDSKWVFAKRHIDIVYMGPADMSGRFYETVPYGPAPRDANPDRPATPSMAEAYG